MANYILPLVTVPYLSRVLGAAGWGLVAIAQSFALYGNLIVEYGFVYSGTRQIATAPTDEAKEQIVAGVLGAKLLLSLFVIGAACLAYLFIPVFREHSTLLWTAVLAEIVKASLPNYYFYGINRVAVASALDISARTAAAIGIFIFVHRPEDAWKVFALQGAGAGAALVVGHGMIYSRYDLRWPRMREGMRMLQEGGSMFLFRSAHNMYALGNAFILGLFAPPQVVGYYAGAEKINSAAVGLLSPLTTALYPRAAGLAKTSMRKAARLTVFSLYAMVAVSLVLGSIMWFGSPMIVRVILGPSFSPSADVLKILSLRAPLVAWTYVLGFQWLLSLGLEKSFRNVTVVALVLNVLLATCLAPASGARGMAFAVVISQAAAALGIYFVLRARKLNPFVIGSDPSYA